MTENLWGDLRLPETLPHSPEKVLRDQAKFLSELTHKALEANVYVTIEKTVFKTEFVIHTPFLPKYEISILQTEHQETIYPVTIYNVIGIEEVFGQDNRAIKANNEDDFRAVVQKILQSNKVKKILQSLIVQAQEEKALRQQQVIR